MSTNIGGSQSYFSFPVVRPAPCRKKTIFLKLQTAIYPSSMAPIGAKLWENAFQTIPDISFFDAENNKNNCRTLNGRLPLEHGSVRPQTLGKRVSDDSQHFIFRRRKKNWRKFSMKKFVKNFFRRKIDKLPVFAELWIFGRNRQMRLEKLPPKF